ncbi:MAG: ABC transporter permease [Lewinellaceae bacterium]|nr:ABC transporter permease [Lewinellaceae bacterium]
MAPLSETIRQAFRSIKGNWLRAMLTLSIIAFGIMALVGILTAIDSIITSLSDNFSSLGANSFSITPKGNELGGQRHGRRLKQGEVITFDQAMTFKDRFDFPARVSVSYTGTGNAEARYADKKTNPTISLTGVDAEYLYVNGYDLEIGRNFVPTEIESNLQRAIIGMDIVKLLFDDQPEKALDQSIYVSNRKYKVIGILQSKGSSMSQAGDRIILVPISTVKEAYGTQNTNYNIAVAVNQSADLDEATDAAIGTFRAVRGLKLNEENDFEIFKSDGLVSILKENTVQIRLAAVGIGIITLLGAAIGLMNIMLVSVAERTREIGVIKALGAKNRDIMIQFLVEAVLICQLGGILGVILGIFAGNAVSLLIGSKFIIPWAWMFLGIITTTVVGLVAGIYPAAKASRLDPIESLRYE